MAPLIVTQQLTKIYDLGEVKVVALGQTVAASLQAPTLFLIAQDLTLMQVDTNVSEADIGKIQEGQRVTFTVDAYPDMPFAGKVVQVRGQSPQGTDQDDVVLIPFSTAERKVLGTPILGTVGVIFASAMNAEAIPEAGRQITALLRQRHHIRAGQTDDFSIRNLSDIAATAESTSRMMGVLLASVASVSLLVGGIGIMNIMLVSVTERTREIGIRMAVGAKQWHILTQFLLEAMVLSLIGGLVGVMCGIIGAKLVSAVAGWPTLLAPQVIVLAVVFSGAVGVFFGFYPARRAAHLDPIQALRYE